MLFQNEVHQLCIGILAHATITQLRMNNVMVVHIHKHFTDKIDVVAALNEFVSVKEDDVGISDIFIECVFHV